ncbi:MAG: 2-phosphosulfolactate phosphatase [Candidatus Hydrogenedens sp.]|jgi:2-phosphosulfolactate phosphatase|nr:2-phosphosulfolactate phosphatase [Candidatus Hydrogenedens sp.]
MIRIHLAEGEEGCRLAVERRAVAVIVDALRASATAAGLLEAGALEICAVREVEEALAMKKIWPDALLYGERGGLPPEGFDFGNSPAEAFHAKGRRVVFTTTTGAGRLISASGAKAALMATTTNDTALMDYLCAEKTEELVIIPAGLAGDPDFDGQEDWVAAVWLADQCVRHQELGAHLRWGEGEENYCYYRERIEKEGVKALFHSAPHADKLRAISMEKDIDFCAQTGICNALPVMVGPCGSGVLLQAWTPGSD